MSVIENIHEMRFPNISMYHALTMFTWSNVVYKFSYGRWYATYYRETCPHLSVRVGEHSGVSPLTGKKLKSRKTAAVKDQMLFCDRVVSIDYFKILATSDSDFHVKVKEKKIFWYHVMNPS